MARYYFYLHECGSITEDDDGVEYVDIRDAQRAAMKAAREVMCEEVSQGRLCLACYIEIADESGSVVMTLSFRDAVTVTGDC